MKVFDLDLLHEKTPIMIERANHILKDRTCLNKNWTCETCPLRLKHTLNINSSNVRKTDCAYIYKYKTGGVDSGSFIEICEKYLKTNIAIQEELEI